MLTERCRDFRTTFDQDDVNNCPTDTTTLTESDSYDRNRFIHEICPTVFTSGDDAGGNGSIRTIRNIRMTWDDNKKSREMSVPGITLEFSTHKSTAMLRLAYRLKYKDSSQFLLYISIHPENIKAVTFLDAKQSDTAAQLTISMNEPGVDLISYKKITYSMLKQNTIGKLSELRSLASITELKLTIFGTDGKNAHPSYSIIDSILTTFSSKRPRPGWDRRRYNRAFLYEFKEEELVQIGPMSSLATNPPPYSTDTDKHETSKKRRIDFDDESNERLVSTMQNQEARFKQIEHDIKTLKGVNDRIDKVEKELLEAAECDHTVCRFNSEEADRLRNDLDTKFDNCTNDIQRESSVMINEVEEQIISALDELREKADKLESDYWGDTLDQIRSNVNSCMSAFEKKLLKHIESAVDTQVERRLLALEQKMESIAEAKMKDMLQGASLTLNI
ncbi:hypothetical protein V8C35DRAFT_294435 [Trichoderma chlorosporum]